MPIITINVTPRSLFNETVIAKFIDLDTSTGLLRAGKLKRSFIISIAIKDWAKAIKEGEDLGRWEMVKMLELYLSGEVSHSTINTDDQTVIGAANEVWEYLVEYGGRKFVRIDKLHTSKGNRRNLRLCYWLALERFARKLEAANPPTEGGKK